MTHSRSALRNLIVRVLQAGIAMVTSVVVTRMLGAEGRGALALLLVAPLLGARMLSFGVESALVVFAGKTGRRELIGHAGAVVALSGSVGMAAILGLQALGGLPGRELATFAVRALATLALPLHLIAFAANGLLRGAGRFEEYDRGLLVGPAVQLPLALLLLLGLGLGVAGGLGASVGAIGVTAGFLLVRVWLKIPDARPSLPKVSAPMLRFGLKEHAGNLAQYLNLRLDLLLVGIFLGPKETGLYAVAVSLAEVVWFIPDALGTVLLPRIARTGADTARAAAAGACRIALTISSAAALAIVLFGGTLLVVLYGHEFAGAWTPLAWLMPGVVLLSVSKVLSKHLSGTGHPGLSARASLISLIATLILDLALIPTFGLAGAALATTIAYGVHAALCTAGFRFLTGAPLAELAVPSGKDIRRVTTLIRDVFNDLPGAARGSETAKG
ncbi:MAG: hypothetical protein CME06_10855 [Gemmatimonadetes bacterium]|nr:hypothetical protein [Gemmatimonadota bacterium]